MRVNNFVSPDKLLSVLKVPPPNVDYYDRFIDRFLAAEGKLAREETRPFFAALLSSHLRNYVDQWIATGVHEDGSESPRERELPWLPHSAILKYLENYPAKVGFSASDGLTVAIAQPMAFHDKIEQPLLAVQVEAERFVTGLMVSDWKEQLCKCRLRECNRYFLLKKPRRVYQHGTFCCRLHQARASALSCTTSRRNAAHEELLDIAARLLNKWRVKGANWVEDAKLRARLARAVAQYVSSRPNLRAQRQGVKINWVTRNWRAIEQKRCTGMDVSTA